MHALIAAEGNILRPRIGVVITTWTQEDGADYARSLVDTLPAAAPDDVCCVISPMLLETEQDIGPIQDFLADKGLDALCLIPGNFTLDHVMPLMAESMGLATILWGLASREAWGALVGLQQTFFPFKELGLPYKVVMAELDDPRAWEKVERYGRAAALLRRLKGKRIGLMGWRAQGMSDVVFDELALRETFGVQVVNVGLTRYSRTVEAIPASQVEETWSDVSKGYAIGELSDAVRHMGVRSYLAMKTLATEFDLQAVTVECFHDHLGEPCLGCSLFNDRGTAASCEADVPSAVLMLAGQMLSGKPTFHADIFHVDFPANTAVFGHCGNLPRRLAGEADEVRIRPAREFGAGFAGPIVEGTMRPGPVTIVNLVGRRGNMRICAMEAEVIPYEIEVPGSWARIAFPFPLAQGLELLAEEGYGHHFVIIDGHVGDIVGEWCELLDIVFLSINEYFNH